MEVIIDPSRFAWIAMFSWPFVVLLLFRYLSKVEAILYSVICGVLLLPALVGIPLPLAPPPTKHTLPILTCFAVLLALTFRERRAEASAKAAMQSAPRLLDPDGTPSIIALRGWIPRSKIFAVLALTSLLSPIGTYMTNTEMLFNGDNVRVGLQPLDAVRGSLKALYFLIPFLVARKYLAHPATHLAFLKVLFWATVAYTPLVLWELRLSPQLHRDIYGFLPQVWVQLLRGDGYRPLVFFQHGLKLSMFITLAVIAGIGYWKAVDSAKKGLILPAVVYLGVILTLLNSFGALFLALVFAPIAIFLFRRGQLIIAGLIALTVIAYPSLRGSSILPLDFAVQQFASIDAGRAGSLGFRIENEEILLEHGNQKPLFGWGSYSRHRVIDERGRDISVTDGVWIIHFNQKGHLGYLSMFGLLGLPILLLMIKGPRFGIPLPTACLGLVLAVNLLDLIPNSSFFATTSLLAGALWGRLELGRLNNSEMSIEYARGMLESNLPEEESGPLRAGHVRTRFPKKKPLQVSRKSRIVRRDHSKSRVVRRNGGRHPILPKNPG